MLFAWRFSRTFASRFNFANVVFFLPAKVDLQVVQQTRTYWARRPGAAHGSPVGGRTTSPQEASPRHALPRTVGAFSSFAVIVGTGRHSRVAVAVKTRDPERPNLIVRLRGRGTGPSLAFLGHLDVVPAHRLEWQVEPFAGVERDGAIWGRGAVDMKCQVAATTVALASLARGGFEPDGDLMVLLMTDEENGSAGVGAPFFIEARPELCPDFVIGEGAGERFATPTGPLYLLDHGVKSTASAELTVRGRSHDASLPLHKGNALVELARLITRLDEYESPVRILPEIEPLIDALAPGDGPPESRLAAARAAHPGLDRVIGALVANVFQPSIAQAPEPKNLLPYRATLTISCITLPGVTAEDLERELREALGPGDYELDITQPPTGGSTSSPDSLLRTAIEEFLAEADPEARLVPALAYGFSDCHWMREAYGTTAYGWLPFRYADPMVNLESKHGVDERVLIDDLDFQVRAARAI